MFHLCSDVYVDTDRRRTKALLRSITNKSIVSPLHLFWEADASISFTTTLSWGSVCEPEELFVMTFFIGCDTAKAKLDIAVVTEVGTALSGLAATIPNEPENITTMLLTLSRTYPNDKFICVVEATGCYHLAFADVCHELGIVCRVYNPLITRQQIKASVRGKKTDRSDALMIARLGLRGEGRPYVPDPYKVTKYYSRGYQRLTVLNSSFRQYKNHLSALVDSTMTDDLKELLDGIQIAVKEARAQLYKDLAASADGIVFRRLQTIPGVGPYIAASIIGEVQDMQRFTTTKSIIAYAGLDPRIRQSGKSLNSTGRLTKRGSAYLRRSLFLAANVARRYDPYFQALYDKKRAEGKRYTVANCVVARKILTIMRAVWLSETNYDQRFWT